MFGRSHKKGRVTIVVIFVRAEQVLVFARIALRGGTELFEETKLTM